MGLIICHCMPNVWKGMCNQESQVWGKTLKAYYSGFLRIFHREGQNSSALEINNQGYCVTDWATAQWNGLSWAVPCHIPPSFLADQQNWTRHDQEPCCIRPKAYQALFPLVSITTNQILVKAHNQDQKAMTSIHLHTVSDTGGHIYPSRPVCFDSLFDHKSV